MRDRERADAKFFALRESGYTGPIDHNGDPVKPGNEVKHLMRLVRAQRHAERRAERRARRQGKAGRR